MHLAHVHVEDLPDVAVEVLEGPAVHPAAVHGFPVFAAAPGDCARDYVIDVGAVERGESDQHLRIARRVGDLFAGTAG